MNGKIKISPWTLERKSIFFSQIEKTGSLLLCIGDDTGFQYYVKSNKSFSQKHIGREFNHLLFRSLFATFCVYGHKR